MLNFYKSTIHLNIELSYSEPNEIWVTEAAICPLHEISSYFQHCEVHIVDKVIDLRQLMTGSVHSLYLTPEEFICFMYDWFYNMHPLFKSNDIRAWIKDYFTCYYESLDAETKIPEYSTYEDVVAISHIIKMLDNLKDPTYLENVRLNTRHIVDFSHVKKNRNIQYLQPEDSMMIATVLISKGYADGDKDLYSYICHCERIISRNAKIIKHNFNKLSVLDKYTATPVVNPQIPVSRLTNYSISDIIEHDTAIMIPPLWFFQPPFTTTDFEVNYVYINKMLERVKDD